MQDWTRCVALEIGLPLWPFNFLFVYPDPTQKQFLETFGHSGFYNAQILGLTDEKFVLKKYNL